MNICARLPLLTYSRTLQVLTCSFNQYGSSLTLKNFSTEVLNSCKYPSKIKRHRFEKFCRNSKCFSEVTRHLSDMRVQNAPQAGTTIFSLSSGHGKCGVAVVRVSGSKAEHAMKLIAQFQHVPAPREATLRKLVDPETGVIIDKGIVILFPGPHSFTGEDCVEFQIHGGPAVVSALLTALHKIPGCQQAEPGEFTKRAFMNGKMDLTEVEGLGDLIHAETEAQRRQALRQMDGDLSKLYSRWRKTFIKCAADLEAFIDFGEDQNIEEHVLKQVKERLGLLQHEIQNHLNDKRQGERLRQGVHVVIIGEPNVGKSSLLNAICQRPAAIVTDIAGTTRDVIETHVNIGGYPVLLSDTAGLRETQDLVEKEGVSRAVKRAKEADVKVVVVDVTSQDISDFMNTEEFLSNHLIQLGLDKTNAYAGGNELKGIEIENSGGNCFNIHTNTTDTTDSTDFTNAIIVLNKVDLVDNSEVLKLYKAFGDSGKTKTEEVDFDNNLIKDLNENAVTQTIDVAVENLNNMRENINFEADPDRNGVESHNLLKNKSYKEIDNSRKSQIGQTSERYSIKQNIVTSNEKSAATCICCISCTTGEGLDRFLDILKDRVADLCGNPLSNHPSLTQARHRSHLITCLNYMVEYNAMSADGDVVLASEALRCALKEIGKITGKISSEEILDVIFKDFCIGK